MARGKHRYTRRGVLILPTGGEDGKIMLKKAYAGTCCCLPYYVRHLYHLIVSNSRQRNNNARIYAAAARVPDARFGKKRNHQPHPGIAFAGCS